MTARTIRRGRTQVAEMDVHAPPPYPTLPPISAPRRRRADLEAAIRHAIASGQLDAHPTDHDVVRHAATTGRAVNLADVQHVVDNLTRTQP